MLEKTTRTIHKTLYTTIGGELTITKNQKLYSLLKGVKSIWKQKRGG
jgi:hypothetical protein